MPDKKKAKSHGILENALVEPMKKGKPTLRIHASMDDGYMMEDKRWRKEEIKRLEQEIKSLSDQLSNWDGESVAEQAKKSLSRDLAVKKARLMEAEALNGD